jgi:hypothetical protein
MPCMSLGIDMDAVTAVLLADGWHEVTDASFMLDLYEFLLWPEGKERPPRTVHRGGASGICMTGFQFAEQIAITGAGPSDLPSKRVVRMISGPLTAILAVRTLAEA